MTEFAVLTCCLLLSVGLFLAGVGLLYAYKSIVLLLKVTRNLQDRIEKLEENR